MVYYHFCPIFRGRKLGKIHVKLHNYFLSQVIVQNTSRHHTYVLNYLTL